MATCNTMCPQSEMEFRSKNHLISQLEATTSTSNGPKSKYVADPKKMVKEYSRSAADTHKSMEPHLLRPYPVLLQTVEYLLELYRPFKGRKEAVATRSFSSIFSFVTDRLRSVRQDMCVQNLRGNASVVLIEKMLPFYIETDAFCKLASCSNYDRKLHGVQLEECFGRWYEELSVCVSISPDPAVAACFYLRQLHRNSTLLHDLYVFRRRLPLKTFEIIREIISTFNSRNYYRFFTQLETLDPLLVYALTDSISTLRQSAMRTISIAFKTPSAKLSTKSLSGWLGFSPDSETFQTFIQMFNVIPDECGNILVCAIKPFEIPYDDFTSRMFK